MGAHQQIRPVMRHSERIKLMLELNAAGNRAICQPDGTIISEPIAAADQMVSPVDAVNWSRPD